MANGVFYFIDDQFFVDFPDIHLMKNKEPLNGQFHNRPCFLAFEDNAKGLFWMIPISSQIVKFSGIYASKVQKYNQCDTLVFGEVLGHRKAFLIQNMFPVTSTYLSSTYLDPIAGLPVRVDGVLEADVIRKAKKVLQLQRQGRRLIFPDVLAIEAKLIQLSKQAP